MIKLSHGALYKLELTKPNSTREDPCLVHMTYDSGTIKTRYFYVKDMPCFGDLEQATEFVKMRIRECAPNTPLCHSQEDYEKVATEIGQACKKGNANRINEHIVAYVDETNLGSGISIFDFGETFRVHFAPNWTDCYRNLV